jgi:putative OPT family oligopeptide transporter
VLNTTAMLGDTGKQMAKLGLELHLFGLAALFGLGYIIGLKYASIIASGSLLACLVFVPVIVLFGKNLQSFTYGGETYQIAAMSPKGVFDAFVKPIGIGAIAISGLIGIIRMSRIVADSVSLGFKGLSKSAGAEAAAVERTQRDLSPKAVLLIQGVSTLAMGVLFLVVSLGSYGFDKAIVFALVGMVVGFLLSFLFTPVAAQAIAIVGTNPVSGMTLITIVLSILAMTSVGLAGKPGIFIALVIGAAVCTALSTSGALITDFKIGYWIGSTPRNQQVWKFAGILLAAAVVAVIVPLMDSAYHFLVQDPVTGKMVSNTDQLPAPQANMLAAVAKGLMTDPSLQPWLLYGLGGIVAIVLFMAGVPMLAFALGMYLPLGLNLAVLAGAFAAWIVAKTGQTDAVKLARAEQGALIASGLMAGASIFGILTAVLRLGDIGQPIHMISVGVKFGVLKDTPAEWFKGSDGRIIGLVMLLVLAVLCYFLARLGAKWDLAARPADPAPTPPEKP